MQVLDKEIKCQKSIATVLNIAEEALKIGDARYNYNELGEGDTLVEVERGGYNISIFHFSDEPYIKSIHVCKGNIYYMIELDESNPQVANIKDCIELKLAS